MATIYPKMVIFGNDSNQYSIMNEIRNYLREITKRLQAGGQTEMSYRTDFQVLLRQLLPKEIAITEEAQCGFLKKVDSVNVTLLLILLYVDFLAFSPVRG